MTKTKKPTTTVSVAYQDTLAAEPSLKKLADLGWWPKTTTMKFARLLRIVSDANEDFNQAVTRIRMAQAKRDENGEIIRPKRQVVQPDGTVKEVTLQEGIVPINPQRLEKMGLGLQKLTIEVEKKYLITQNDIDSFDPPEEYEGEYPSAEDVSGLGDLFVWDMTRNRTSVDNLLAEAEKFADA